MTFFLSVFLYCHSTCLQCFYVKELRLVLVCMCHQLLPNIIVVAMSAESSFDRSCFLDILEIYFVAYH